MNLSSAPMPTGSLRIKDIESICPFWEICATPQLHMRDKWGFISSVCTGKYDSWSKCTHYMGLAVISKEEISNIKRRMRETYGETKYSIR